MVRLISSGRSADPPGLYFTPKPRVLFTVLRSQMYSFCSVVTLVKDSVVEEFDPQ